MSGDEWKAISDEFSSRWNFPHVVGALDGKHFPIIRPPKGVSFYFNYKSFHSLVLLALVDSDYQFIYFDLGAEGRANDASIWKKSSLFKNLIEKKDWVFVLHQYRSFSFSFA